MRYGGLGFRRPNDAWCGNSRCALREEGLLRAIEQYTCWFYSPTTRHGRYCTKVVAVSFHWVAQAIGLGRAAALAVPVAGSTSPFPVLLIIRTLVLVKDGVGAVQRQRCCLL